MQKKTITKISAEIPVRQNLKRVAAYARVSSGKDAMKHSLSAQVSYYSDLIQKTPGWEYAGVYSDEAKPGTRDAREDFKRLIKDCEAGQIDMIITKSISRFARNTVLLLQSVRHLKSLGVDVYFEEQNIHSVSGDGELMLTILASFAQEESRSVSENQKWRIRNCFNEGRPWNMNMLGYRQENGSLIIVPEEAELVRRIFNEYLEGKGPGKIVKELNAEGIPAPRGGEWGTAELRKILKNTAYTGNLKLQRFFRETHISPYSTKNTGELPIYKVDGSHPPIISEETFDAVQNEIVRRAEKHKDKAPPQKYPYSLKIDCGNCGKKYRRKLNHGIPVWKCITFDYKGKAACPSKQIPESVLDDIFAGVNMDTIEKITACNGNILIAKFTDGREEHYVWKDRSRSESWTPEMKKLAGERLKERKKING
ncbi:MAG: recombinase family protein [Clostridia bacterium]|nr:recombinase family protein [Clostridia bacterium]